MQANQQLLSLINVSKRYGSTQALANTNLTVQPGEVVGLIGPNGAGKSTLLKAALGLIRAEGDIRTVGYKPGTQRAAMLRQISYVADVASLPGWISVKRLLEYMEDVHPSFSREQAQTYLSRTEITEKHLVKSLSKGMKAQLHLALILGIEARLLVLDEPTLGLDIIHRTDFYQTLVNDYMTPERSILVTTHQVEEIEDILSRIVFIADGRITLDMQMDEIENHFLAVDLTGDETIPAKLEPIYRQKSGDKTRLIVKRDNDIALPEIPNTRAPSITELFLAYNKNTTREES